LHYFCQVAGEFGPETNRFEPWSLRLHGGFAAMALALLGSLLPMHIVPGLRSSPGQWLDHAGDLGVLALSGYLLYYVGGDGLRQTVSLAHWIIGLWLPLSLLIHLRQRTARRARER
jgi:hypothetical protein